MIKTIRDWLIVAILRMIIWLGKILPWPMRIRMGGAIIGWISYLPRIARETIGNNLTLIYPDWTEGERKRFTKANLRHFGQNMVELYNIKRFSEELPYFHPSGPGWAVLKAQREKGEGAVIVSGHFGNWEAIRAYLNANGMPLAAVYKESPNPYYEKMFHDALVHNGPVFHTGVRGMAGLVRELKSGNFISLLHDQRVKGAPRMPFLGHDAETSTAPAEMALKYSVPLIPVYAIRRDDGRNYDLIAEDPIEPSDALTMTQAMTDSLSERVWKDPVQWLWIYEKRWR